MGEPPKIFCYKELKFWFVGTNYRTAEKLLLYIEIPKRLFLLDDDIHDYLPVENYLLRILETHINALSEEAVNINKDVHDKPSLKAQKANELVIKRNGMVYDGEKESFVLRINFNVPLIKALSINSKSTFKAVKSILDLIDERVKNFNGDECKKIYRNICQAAGNPCLLKSL